MAEFFKEKILFKNVHWKPFKNTGSELKKKNIEADFFVYSFVFNFYFY